MSVTIKDVAAAANVSIGTVDRVLNNRPYVRDEVRKRVYKEIERLGYIPNKIASLLSTGAKKTIGLLCFEYPSFFWDEIVRGAVTAAEELKLAGVILHVVRVIATQGGAKKYREILQDLCKDDIDFLLTIGVYPEDTMGIINQYNIPTATINIDLPELPQKIFYIGPDDGLCGRIAAGLIRKTFRTGNSLVVTGANLVTSHLGDKRGRGFSEAMKNLYPETPNIDYYKCTEKNGLNRCRSIEDYVREKPIDSVYISNGDIIDSCEMNLVNSDGNRPVVVAHELSQKTYSLLLEDKIDFVINQNPFYQGFEAVKKAYTYLNIPNAPIQSFVSADLRIVTREML